MKIVNLRSVLLGGRSCPRNIRGGVDGTWAEQTHSGIVCQNQCANHGVGAGVKCSADIP